MISVNHRYADTPDNGRKETFTSHSRAQELTVAQADELKDGQMKLLLDQRPANRARPHVRGYCAFDDRCTHRGGSLAGGVLIGDTVQCLWHGSQFDVCTGEVLCRSALARRSRSTTIGVRGEDVTLVAPDARD